MLNKKELLIVSELKKFVDKILNCEDFCIAELPYNQKGMYLSGKFECKWLTVVCKNDEIELYSPKEYKKIEDAMWKYVEMRFEG